MWEIIIYKHFDIWLFPINEKDDEDSSEAIFVIFSQDIEKTFRCDVSLSYVKHCSVYK